MIAGPDPLPASAHAVAGAAYCMALAWAARRAPWRRLHDPVQLNVWLGTIVALSAAWSLRAAAYPGFELHLSGAALAALMFGAPLAIIALAAVIAAVTVAGTAPPAAIDVDALLTTVLPVIIVAVLQRISDARLPKNYFVYFFVVAFGGTLLATAAAAVAVALFHAAFAAAPATDVIAYSLLLAWGEAVVTGMLVSVFVAYRPAWMRTFDDKRYFERADG
jgi:uncharacterized membrane protein